MHLEEAVIRFCRHAGVSVAHSFLLVWDDILDILSALGHIITLIFVLCGFSHSVRSQVTFCLDLKPTLLHHGSLTLDVA